MALILRIQWLALATFVGASLFLRGTLVAAVPPENYAIQSIFSRGFIAFWLGWLLWYSFGPGRRRPFRRHWLFLDPLVAWAAHVPSITSMWLTWPWARPQDLLMFVIFHMAAMTANAFGSARLPPSRGFGSWLPVVLPAALVLFFLTHPSPVSRPLALWVAAVGIAFLFAREAVERLLNDAEAARRTAAEALATVAAERDAKSRFLASASHDLGQPIQAARLFFDQAMRSRDAAERAAAARNTRWAFDTTEALLRRIIDHLRLDAGRIEAQRAAVPIGAAIARVAELHDPAALLAGVRLRPLPSRLVAIADPMLLDSALGNFVANALRHAGARGVVIGARRHGDRVRLWVIDDGKGIAPADVDRLFGDYVQGSDHGDQVRGGFGLGLASARRMARLMGGDAGFDPRWRRGSAFWLELPAG